MDDVDDIDGVEVEQNNLDYVDMENGFAYLPCAAHNFQLVLKDGFKLDKVYDDLLKRVTAMVGKSKKSSVVAEQLREFDKFLSKSVITRWNSILFLVRSILKINKDELQQIRNNLPTKTKSQQKTKDLFRLSQIDRVMLDELRNLLVLFEFVTNELQTNEVSISRVYPCYLYLQSNLTKDLDTYKYTKQMRKDLLNSLEKRFGELVGENDIFMLSTMLDPNFGKGAIPRSELGLAMARLKDRLIKNSSRPIVIPENENKNSSSSEK